MDTVVAVVGGGPAGIAASVQLHRAAVPVLLIESKGLGGLVRNASLIENYPPFAVPPSGRRFAQMLEKMVKARGVPHIFRRVLRIDVDRGGVVLHTMDGPLRSRYCIFAAGTEPVRLPADGETEALEAGRLFYEVVDVPEKATSVVVIGGGEIAQDYALSLAASGACVTMITRSGLKGVESLRRRLMRQKEIRILCGHQVVALAARVDGVRVRCDGEKGKAVYECDYVVVAIGRRSANAPIRHIRNLRVRPDGSTHLRRLFLAGSCRYGPQLRHIAVAAGDGLACACRLLRRLLR